MPHPKVTRSNSSEIAVIDAPSFVSSYGYLGLLAVVPVGGTIALSGVLIYWAYKKCYPDKETNVIPMEDMTVQEAWIELQSITT